MRPELALGGEEEVARVVAADPGDALINEPLSLCEPFRRVAAFTRSGAQALADFEHVGDGRAVGGRVPSSAVALRHPESEAFVGRDEHPAIRRERPAFKLAPQLVGGEEVGDALDLELDNHVKGLPTDGDRGK
jgi:hypothetical protein